MGTISGVRVPRGSHVRIDPKARSRAKGRLRELTSRRWGISMERRIREVNSFTVGWMAYFSLADTPRPLSDLDEWLRRRLRQIRWKEWKRPLTRRRSLQALGVPPQQAGEWAGTRKGYWRFAGSAPLNRALPDAYWRDLGLQGFTIPYRRFRDATRARSREGDGKIKNTAPESLTAGYRKRDVSQQPTLRFCGTLGQS